MFHVVVVVSHKNFPCNWPLLLGPFDVALMRTELFNVALRQIVVVHLSTLFVYRVKEGFCLWICLAKHNKPNSQGIGGWRTVYWCELFMIVV